MKFKGSLALLFIAALALFSSCTKINESTQLGDELLPAIDNVNTFETSLDVQAAYFPFIDSSRHERFENFALGRLNDVAYGTTNADAYFNFSSPVPYGTNPFVNRDTVKAIDSVVLSLGFQAAYGDTSTTQIAVEVSEILSGTKIDSVYRYDVTGFNTGAVLGRRTFTIREIKDSVRIVRKGDTTKVANALRIRLDNTFLGEKLRNFDTSLTKPNPGFASDSLFRDLFKGLAVKTTNASGAGALAYFNIADPNTRLIVYYKAGKATGVDSGASLAFTPFLSVFSKNLDANSIVRTPNVNFTSGVANATSQLLHLQSSPSGSYIGIKIPGLDTFSNKVIHRAELIAYQVPSAFPMSDLIFKEPNLLMLEHKGPADSSYLFESDLPTAGTTGAPDFASFGGRKRSDNSYRFAVTRYVQGIVTRKERNDSFRLYAPIRTYAYTTTSPRVRIAYPGNNILDNPAAGRIVIANNNYPDPNRRLRLRIVYSNL